MTVATGGAAAAQTVDRAEASIDIHRGLNVNAIRPLRMQLRPEGATLGLSTIELADGPALVEVTGDANRVYSVQILNGDEGAASFEIWSVNAGDISRSRIAVMDADGHDLLRLTGDPAALRRVLGGTTSFPLTIQYE